MVHNVPQGHGTAMNQPRHAAIHSGDVGRTARSRCVPRSLLIRPSHISHTPCLSCRGQSVPTRGNPVEQGLDSRAGIVDRGFSEWRRRIQVTA